jgi:hypothetical protein
MQRQRVLCRASVVRRTHRPGRDFVPARFFFAPSAFSCLRSGALERGECRRTRAQRELADFTALQISVSKALSAS